MHNKNPRIISYIRMRLTHLILATLAVSVCSCSSTNVPVASRADDRTFYMQVTSNITTKDQALSEITAIMNRLPKKGEIGQITAEYLIKQFQFIPKDSSQPPGIIGMKIKWRDIKEVSLRSSAKTSDYYVLLEASGAFADIANIAEKSDGEKLIALIRRMVELNR